MSIMEAMAKKKPRRRRSFTPEFKAEVVALVRQPGHTAGGVARELKLTETACGSGSSRPNGTRESAPTG
jgi:transposase